MSNKHLSRPPTDLIRARLQVLLDNVNYLYKSATESQVVEEDLVSAYSDAMSLFIKSLDGSITGAASKILKGSPADPFNYNIITNSMARDLEALFQEVGVLDKLIVSSFNSIIAEQEQVLQISRRVSNKLGDYLLYADPALGGGYFFGDSFNSAESIEVSSPLVDGDECFLGQDEGVILLPLDGAPDRPKIKSYIINAPSNGTAGNNFEIGVLGKDELVVLGDNEPNTWFEYEKVVAGESNKPLVFDLTIALKDISVINHIHINPINFGTPSPVKVVKLETSKDGLEYVSIKDEVPLKDFVSEDEDDTFELSPATSKFAGQGFYSFLPRKAQYIHVVFEQHTPYAINTLNGSRLRYAIGIRDINILGRKFKTEGSIVSVPFAAGNEIRKVSLWASENPIEASELADIVHFVSENDGAVWRPLQPQRRSGFEVPEVINFNNIASGSISTDTEVTTLRHKISMKRDTDAFFGNAVLKEEKETKTELVNVPTGGDFSFTVTDKPIPESMRIVLPFYGSFSCPTVRTGADLKANGVDGAGLSAPMNLDFLEFSVDVPPIDILRFDLPYAGFQDLREKIRVFVNGEQIEYCSDADSDDTSYGDHSNLDEDSKIYFLNKAGRQLQFGDGTPGSGRIGFLPSGAKIQVCLDGDNPRLELTDAGYILNLSADSDGIKENMSLVSVDTLDDPISPTGSESREDKMELTPGRLKYGSLTQASQAELEAGIKAAFEIAQQRITGTINKSLGDGDTSGIDATLSEQSSQTLEVDAIGFIVSRDDLSSVKETEDGVLPPMFIGGTDNFRIDEYDLDGVLIDSGHATLTQQYSNSVEFENGEIELVNPEDYSFDNTTGVVHLNSTPSSDRKTYLIYQQADTTSVPQNGWEFYKAQASERIDTGKMVLSPKYVNTSLRTVSGTANQTSIQLITDSSGEPLSKAHAWYKQRLVKGTVALDSTLFAEGARPTEVLFVNGASELRSINKVIDEPITFSTSGSTHSFTLDQIDSTDRVVDGSPTFAAVRQPSVATTPASQFTTPVADAASLTPANGEWYMTTNTTTGVVTVTLYLTTTPNSHTVVYHYLDTDPGVDVGGLYSVDYDSATIHFATPTAAAGDVAFEVSQYSAFYNIAEIVPDGDIKEINEEEQKVTLSESFGMRFLKLNTALKARPSFMKVVYDFYKTSTESLEDLEPYFSPIAKDIALRAVTIDVLEEL